MIGALAKMMDDTECLIFLNTPNSITVRDSIDKTFSPWIYSELLISNIVRRKKWKAYRRKALIKATEIYHMDESADLTIEFPAKTEHLLELTVDELEEWMGKNGRNRLAYKSMDMLYLMKGLIEGRPIYG